MGNVDRLLAALAQQLPPNSSKDLLLSALRAAAESIPESLAKTQRRLRETEDECLEKLHRQLQVIKESEADEAAAAAAEEPFAVDVAPAAEAEASDLYEGLTAGNPLACLQRCSALLSDAVMGLRPAKRAEGALAGLVGLLPPDAKTSGATGVAFTLEAVEACAQLIPIAKALLPPDHNSPLWCKFLGLILGAPLRLAKVPSGQTERAADLAGRLSSLVALVAQPSAARSALRLALSWTQDPPSGALSTRLARLLTPSVHAAFGSRALDEGNASFTRGDLLGLLLAVRAVGLCGSEADAGLAEARGSLRAALLGHVDAAVLLPELRRLAQAMPTGLGRHLRRRLKGAGAERADATAAIFELVEGRASAVTLDSLVAFASNCGLPVGEEEDFDVKAAAAHARGDIFFEDVGDAVPDAGGAVEAEVEEKEQEQEKEEAVKRPRKRLRTKSLGSALEA